MVKKDKHRSGYIKETKDHWQKNMDLTPKGASDGKGAFLPRPGDERPTTHVKVNECDH